MNYAQLKVLIGFLFIVQSTILTAQCTSNAGVDTTICPGGTALIGGVNAATGNGPFTYTWSPTSNLSCTNCASPSASPISTTTYTLTITDGDGCTSSDDVTVFVSNLPDASFNFLPNTVCASTPIQFGSTTVNPGFNYMWNFGNPASGSNNTSSNPNPIHEFIATGSGTQNFNVSLTVTNGIGCTSSTNQNVAINQIPGASLIEPIGNFKNCDGSNYMMTVYNTTMTNPNANYQIIWGDGSADFMNSNFPGSGVSHVYSTADIFDLYFIVTGTNGCTDTLHQIVSNITNPAIGAANPGATTGCGPITLCFPLSNYVTNHPSTIYIVDYGDNSPIDTLPHPPPAQICHTYTESSCGEPGNAYTFSIQAENLCDNSLATIFPIRVYTGPTANFNASPIPGCINSPVTFTNTSTLGFNSSCQTTTIFNWNFGDGTTLTQFALANPTHSYALAGTYTVTLSAQNGCGTTVFSQAICIEEPPVPLFSVTPDSACIPFTATTLNTSDTLNTCNFTYNWSVIYNGSTCLPSTGNWNFVNGTNANSWNPEFQFNSAGFYRVRLQMTNSCGIYYFEDTVIAQSIPQVSLLAPGPICAGESINPSAIVNDCYELTDSYDWTFSNGIPNSSNVLLPGPIQFDNPGVFNIELEAQNDCGSVSATVPITVNAPPSANAGPDVEFCSGFAAGLGTSSASGVSYQWSPNLNLSNANASNPVVGGTNSTGSPISQEYIVTASTSPTCFTTDTVSVIINPLPALSVNNPTICLGESVQLLVTGAGSSGSYLWNSNPDLSCSDCDNPTVSPIFTTNYQVTGVSEFNCQSTIVSSVTVNPLPSVDAGPDQILCDQPISIQLNGIPNGGIWTGSPNVTSSGVFTPNGAEVVVLNYLYTNPSTNCQNSDQLTITVNPTIIPTIDDLDSICINNGLSNLEVLFSANPIGGSFQGSGVSGQLLNPIAAGVGTHEIIYFYGSGTCHSSDTAFVIVHDVPTLVTSNSVICEGDTTILSVTGAGIGGAYSWSPSTSLSCVNCSNPEAFPFTSTNYTITGTNLSGCSSTINSNVLVNSLPIVDAGPDLFLCDQPVPIQLNSSPVNGFWSGSSNVSATGEFIPNGTETATLVYLYTNPSTGCSNFDTTHITVSPPIIPSFNDNEEICFEVSPVNISAYTNISPTGGTWTGTGVSGNLFNPSIAGVGIHDLTYIQGTGSCQTTSNVSIVVNPQPIISVNDEVICLNDTTLLFASGAGVSGSYTWTPSTNLSCSSCSNPLAFPSTTSNYTVTGTNEFGCSNTDISTVTVNALPIANAGNDTILCNLPSSVQFIGQQVGGAWSGSGIDINGNFTPNGIGDYVVTYTILLGTGCQNSDDMIITVVDPTVSDAGSDLDDCTEQSVVQLNGIPLGGTWSGTNVTSSGEFSLIQDGTFYLVYSTGSGNCLTTDTMQFVVYPLPVVNAGIDYSVCISEPDFNLSATPANGVWSGMGIMNGISGTFSPSNAGVGNHTVTYTYTDPITSCVNSDQIVVVVSPLPVPSFTVNPIVCTNQNVQFTNSSTLLGFSSWDFGDGLSTNVQNPTHQYLNTGFFDVQLIVTSNFGCTDSITQTIEVLEPPIANFTVSPDSLCGPLDASFTNLSSGISVSYNWDFGNGSSTSAQNPNNVIYQSSQFADTNYLITLDVSNFCGTVQHQESILVSPEPTAIFGTDFNTGCSPWTVNIANTSIGLPDTYYWDFGDGTTSTTDESLFSHVFTTGSTPSNYTIMLVVENECGVDTSYHVITVLPNTVDAFFNTSTVQGCEDLSVDFTQYTLGGTNYSWDFGDGNTSTAYSPSHIFSNPGTYDVALMANDGCSFDTTTVTITVFPSPQVSFNYSPDSVCINTPFDFINTSQNLANSVWDFGDGNQSNLTNPSHEFSAPGDYLVTLTGTGLVNGCTAVYSDLVHVSTNPIASFVANPLNGCAPLPVQFINQSTNASYFYWNFGDGNTSGLPNPVHTFTDAGTYTVQLIVENTNGCTDTAFLNITVYPLPVASFTFVSGNTCYAPTVFNFTNQTVGAINYQWDFGDGSQSNLTNPNHVFQNAGTYTITLTTTNQYGCVDQTQQSITIYPTPLAAFDMSGSVACENDSLLFASTSDFADSIVWNFGDGSIATGSSVYYTYLNAGIYNVTIMAYGAGGCGDTLTLITPITINPDPIADFDYVNVQIPDPVSGTVYFTNLSTNATDYYWEFGNGNSATEENPTHRYYEYGEFYVMLVATNQFGCTDTIYKIIEVDFFNGLFIPNAMYPNHSDFEVSHFVPKGVGMKEFLIQIYDDWGNLIWQSNALDENGRPTESWDGTFQGQPVQQDSYVWKVNAIFLDDKVWEGKEYENNVYKKAGTVTVIR